MRTRSICASKNKAQDTFKSFALTTGLYIGQYFIREINEGPLESLKSKTFTATTQMMTMDLMIMMTMDLMMMMMTMMMMMIMMIQDDDDDDIIIIL